MGQLIFLKEGMRFAHSLNISWNVLTYLLYEAGDAICNLMKVVQGILGNSCLIEVLESQVSELLDVAWCCMIDINVLSQSCQDSSIFLSSRSVSQSTCSISSARKISKLFVGDV